VARLRAPFYRMYYEVSSLSAMKSDEKFRAKWRRKANDNFAKRRASLRHVAFLQHSSYNFVGKTIVEKCAFLLKLRNTSKKPSHLTYCVFTFYNQSKRVSFLHNHTFLQDYYQIIKVKESKNCFFFMIIFNNETKLWRNVINVKCNKMW